jgi:signal transduction histidine kinase
MDRAAYAIADGELDVELPASQVSEVARVSAAFTAMSAALRDSLAQQAALEQDRRLFIAAIAHDLRTPLFALRGYLEGLEKGIATTPEQVARYIAVCRDKAAALERLIADLFAYARTEYLDQTPHPEPLELGALIEDTVTSMRPRADGKGVALLLQPPTAPVPLEGDGHLLVRAVENLLDNALRHTPPGGAVRVDWRGDADQVRFTVADSGPGIAAQDLPHVFEPLYRGERSRNRRTGGAGLGLTIARRILQAHGGELAAANAPGGGALFTGTLPAADPRRDAAGDAAVSHGDGVRSPA